jgi:sugar lactone lactonase YvrE
MRLGITDAKDRRNAVRAAAAAAIAAAAIPAALAGGTFIKGAFGFDPIEESAVVGSLPADAPFVLPDGFSQEVIWDEKGLFSSGPDFYATQSCVPDMHQSNETGKWAGRFLYRTHEVRSALDRDGNGVAEGPYGSLSVTDLETGETKLLVERADWEALDGIKWTPWGTLLFAEEVITAAFGDPDAPQADCGLLYEVALDPKDPSTAVSVTVRPAVGSVSHEGIAIDSAGALYVIDEFASGSIYKFVPDRRADLSSGQLYALEVVGFDFDDYDPSNGDATIDARTGAARWVPLDRTQAQISARVAAQAANGTPYGRPEDLEIVDGVLYAAITSENAVLAIDLKGKDPFVRLFVKSGRNVPVETSSDTGLDNPDNLAIDSSGNVYVIEDNSPGDIWCATPDKDGDGLADAVVLFASLSTPGSEPTGLYFGKDPKVAYVNVQHASGGNDMTIAIRKE